MAFLSTIQVLAQPVDCTPRLFDDREIRIMETADVDQKRLEIIRAIWNASTIPGRSDVFVTRDSRSPLHPHPAIARVDRLEIPVPGIDSLRDLAYLFVAVERNQRLVIYNPGHSCTLADDGHHHYRHEATITEIAAAGFDVLAVFMPHVKESLDPNCHFNHCQVINNDLAVPDPLPTWRLRLFLDPTIVAMNYVMKKYVYKKVDMVGLSGGGWTTNVVAAVDPRISCSFNVAGSVPLYYRSGGSIGDIEQYLYPFYHDIASYPDLYVLGAFGNGRKQIQILNRYDDCCFGQAQHDPKRDYAADMYSFARAIKKRLDVLGQKEHYDLTIDDTAPNHQISEYALTKVILPELKAN
jgi:hypothetical protein